MFGCKSFKGSKLDKQSRLRLCMMQIHLKITVLFFLQLENIIHVISSVQLFDVSSFKWLDSRVMQCLYRHGFILESFYDVHLLTCFISGTIFIT